MSKSEGKPASVAASMTGTADAMERILKSVQQAEEVCGRLTGSAPKATITDTNAFPDGGSLSLVEVAAAQAASLRAIAGRLESAMTCISEAI